MMNSFQKTLIPCLDVDNFKDPLADCLISTLSRPQTGSLSNNAVELKIFLQVGNLSRRPVQLMSHSVCSRLRAFSRESSFLGIHPIRLLTVFFLLHSTGNLFLEILFCSIYRLCLVIQRSIFIYKSIPDLEFRPYRCLALDHPSITTQCNIRLHFQINRPSVELLCDFYRYVTSVIFSPSVKYFHQIPLAIPIHISTK